MTIVCIHLRRLHGFTYENTVISVDQEVPLLPTCLIADLFLILHLIQIEHIWVGTTENFCGSPTTSVPETTKDDDYVIILRCTSSFRLSSTIPFHLASIGAVFWYHRWPVSLLPNVRFTR